VTKRQAILEVIRDRLCAVTRPGYTTNIGREVYVGEKPELGPDDPDEAVAILIEDDRILWQQDKKHIELPFEVVAVVKVAADKLERKQAWLRLESVLEDIKTALETDDRRMGGLLTDNLQSGGTRTLPRESGSEVISVGISYRAKYTESWGQP